MALSNSFLLSTLFTLFTLSESCTKIVVRSSNNEIEWLDGTFLLDPTLVADGRPVYIEVLPDTDDRDQRLIYHYSHEPSDDMAEYINKDFAGRWILGHSMYSGNGWYYTESWSISPANLMMQSLVNPSDTLMANTDDGVPPKLQWRVHIKNDWQFDTLPHITLSCETRFDDITYDWLFITTPNHYEFNILSTSDPAADTHELDSVTETNLHGFYYRVSEDYWRKVESKIFLRKESLSDGVEYSFLFYDEFTNADGTPNADKINGFKVKTHGTLDGHLTDLNSNEWAVVDAQDRQYQAETITVHIVTTTDAEDDIYSAYRRYWSDIKSKSFDKVSAHLTEQQRHELIVSQNNGLPFMMVGLGTGGLQETDAKGSMEYAINEIGYRVIDGAEAYENEVALGQLLSREGQQRDELFITSKVWPTHLGFVQTYQAILSSLNKVRTNYFDLYMIHWNRCDPDISWMHCEQASNRPWGQSWQMMEKLYAEGYLLSIGISNFNFDTFNEMLTSEEMQIVPQVMQNYFDIGHADWELAQHVQRYGVIYQGYAQYRGIAEAEDRAKNGEKHYKVFKDKLEEISVASTGASASASQVLLKWLLRKRIAVIPRSRQRDHLKENWNIWDFELTPDDVDGLTQMSMDQNQKLQKGEL
eukprot:17117_1